MSGTIFGCICAVFAFIAILSFMYLLSGGGNGVRLKATDERSQSDESGNKLSGGFTEGKFNDNKAAIERALEIVKQHGDSGDARKAQWLYSGCKYCDVSFYNDDVFSVYIRSLGTNMSIDVSNAQPVDIVREFYDAVYPRIEEAYNNALRIVPGYAYLLGELDDIDFFEDDTIIGKDIIVDNDFKKFTDDEIIQAYDVYYQEAVDLGLIEVNDETVNINDAL